MSAAEYTRSYMLLFLLRPTCKSETLFSLCPGVVMHPDSFVDFGTIQIVCLFICLITFFIYYFLYFLYFFPYLFISLLINFMTYLSTSSRIGPFCF